MSLLNSIDHDHVLTAIETWDTAGGSLYLTVSGSKSTHVLLHHGREYDAAAIAGIAHGLATGRTLTASDIPGGAAAAAKTLVRLGFEVRDDSPPGVAAATRRTTRATGGSRGTSSSGGSRPAAARPAAKPRVAASDKVYELCPTCFLALPSTGVCDNCA